MRRPAGFTGTMLLASVPAGECNERGPHLMSDRFDPSPRTGRVAAPSLAAVLQPGAGASSFRGTRPGSRTGRIDGAERRPVRLRAGP